MHVGARKLLGRALAPQTQAILRQAGAATFSSARQVQIIDRLVRSLIAAGQWDQLAYLFVPAVADSQTALLNWKMPTTKPLVNSGATFTAFRGFAGDGVSTFFSTTDSPHALGNGVFARDSNVYGTWYLSVPNLGTNVADSGNVFFAFGPRSGTGTTISTRNAASTNTSTAYVGSAGLYTSRRTSSVDYAIWKDDAAALTVTIASEAINTVAFTYGKRNGASSFSTAEFAIVFQGSGNASPAALYALFREYLVAQGAL